MSRYIEIKNIKNIVQLNDTFKPLFLMRKGVFNVSCATKRREQISIKFDLLDNEYNVAIRNRTETPITYFSALLIDPGTKQKYVTIEIKSQDMNIVENLEYYVFGFGQIIPMKKGDVGLEIRNAKGEIIYNSKTPIAKIYKSEIGCAVQTYHANPSLPGNLSGLVWDFGIFDEKGNQYMVRFTPALNASYKEYIMRRRPWSVDDNEYEKRWKTIEKLENKWQEEGYVFARPKRINGVGKMGIMVNRLPCLAMVAEGAWTKCTGTIRLTNNEAILSHTYFGPYSFRHLPWYVGHGVQPMYSLLAVDVSGCGKLSSESGVSGGNKEFETNYNNGKYLIRLFYSTKSIFFIFLSKICQK